MTTLTTPLSIPDLLAGPDLDRSAARAVRDLARTYATWDAVEADALPEDLLRTNHHLKQQRTQLARLADDLARQLSVTVRQTAALLESSKSISIQRHQLSDVVESLTDALESPVSSGSSSQQTLPYEAQALLVALEQAEMVEDYLQVVERLLKLRRVLPHLECPGAREADLGDHLRDDVLTPSGSPLNALPTYRVLHDLATRLFRELPPQIVLPVLAEDILDSSWSGLKKRLSASLVDSSKTIAWPLKPAEEATNGGDSAFSASFLALLSFQMQGEAIHHRSHSAGLYPFEALVEPIRSRWRFHFESDRPTNRLDKPEWPFTHLLNLVHDLHSTISNRCGRLLIEGGIRDVDPVSEFISVILPLAEGLLVSRVPSLLPPQHPALLAHTIHQTLVFDQAIRDAGFDPRRTWKGLATHRSNSEGGWKGLAPIILDRPAWFRAWLSGEAEFSQSELQKILNSPSAWHILDLADLDTEGSEGQETDEMHGTEALWRPTRSAVEILKLLSQITDRYAPLPSPANRFRFFIAIQLPLLINYSTRLSSSLSAFERLASSFARVVPGALAGHTNADGLAAKQEKQLHGVSGLASLLKALLSARAISKGLERWADELFFLQLWADVLADPVLEAEVQRAEGMAYGTGSRPETIFAPQTAAFTTISARAEDMIVRHIVTEVEQGLKPHLTRRWDPVSSFIETEDAVVPPSLVGPLSTFTAHLSYLAAHVPPFYLASLYRSVVSHLVYHIDQRAVLAGWSKFSRAGGEDLASEVAAWVEAASLGLGVAVIRSDRPWKKLIDTAALLSLPVEKSADGEGLTLRVAGQAILNGDKAAWVGVRRALSLTSLSQEDAQKVVRRRVDFV